MNNAFRIALIAAASLPLLAQLQPRPDYESDVALAQAEAAKLSASSTELDVGVYIQTAAGWQLLLPEVVNWKTGGVLKGLGSFGIVKGDVNGHIRGAHSRNAVSATANPIEILICTPSGVEYTEYQLIRLHRHSDSREFRTVTGGVFHASGGPDRDVLDFNATKINRRMWRVSLSGTKPGEYGFLPPDGSSLGEAGKMYTLHLTE